MAHRSQCSSAGDNPLDPNYLPPHYREEYRLSIDALIEEDLDGYYQFLQKADVVDFLSSPEIQYIQSSVQVPQQSYNPEQQFLEPGGDDSSDTYWPLHSDLDAPGLDLGWPQLHSFIGPTEVTTLVNPPEPEMPSIKEQARRLIKNAQQVIAIVMDMFTDVDMFADILDAAMRNVAVYVILDKENAHHFVHMVSNCRVNLQNIQLLRVRTVSGITYHCRSGKSFKGQMMDRFLLTDCRAVLSGNYSFMWSFEKLHRCMAHLFLGQLVSTFDEEFRILFAQSHPLMIENFTPMEELSLSKNRQYPSDRTLYREPKKFQSNDPAHPEEWPRHSSDERMEIDWRMMPLRKESMHSPADVYSRFTSQQSCMDPSFDQGPSKMPMMENLAFKRHSYAEDAHGRYSYPFLQQGMAEPENHGRQSQRGQQPGPGPGIEADYSGYNKFWNQDFYSAVQDSEPGLPQEMEPLDNFDPVLNYLSSTKNADFDQGSEKLLPASDLPFGSSHPRRLNLSQPHACQTSPSPSNLTDQKQFLQDPNVDRKDPLVKQGLRNWRISSYLSAYDNPGEEGLSSEPLDGPDAFEEPSNPIQQTPGINVHGPKIPNVREFKVPAIPRASQIPSYAKTNVREQTNTLPDEPIAVPTKTKTTPTPSESSSSTTEVEKIEEGEQKEPKTAVLRREESFRRKYNVVVPRSSRLRSSMIFSSLDQQHTSQDTKTALEESDKTEPEQTKPPFVLGQRRSTAREPIEWSRYMKSATLNNSATDPSKPDDGNSKHDDTDSPKDNKSKDLSEAQESLKPPAEEQANSSPCIPQSKLPRTVQTEQPPEYLLTTPLYIDMSDPDNRLMFFKELAAKRKASMAAEAEKSNEKAQIKPPTELKENTAVKNEEPLPNETSEKIADTSTSEGLLDKNVTAEDSGKTAPTESVSPSLDASLDANKQNSLVKTDPNTPPSCNQEQTRVSAHSETIELKKSQSAATLPVSAQTEATQSKQPEEPNLSNPAVKKSSPRHPPTPPQIHNTSPNATPPSVPSLAQGTDESERPCLDSTSKKYGSLTPSSVEEPPSSGLAALYSNTPNSESVQLETSISSPPLLPEQDNGSESSSSNPSGPSCSADNIVPGSGSRINPSLSPSSCALLSSPAETISSNVTPEGSSSTLTSSTLSLNAQESVSPSPPEPSQLTSSENLSAADSAHVETDISPDKCAAGLEANTSSSLSTKETDSEQSCGPTPSKKDVPESENSSAPKGVREKSQDLGSSKNVKAGSTLPSISPSLPESCLHNGSELESKSISAQNDTITSTPSPADTPPKLSAEKTSSPALPDFTPNASQSERQATPPSKPKLTGLVSHTPVETVSCCSPLTESVGTVLSPEAETILIALHSPSDTECIPKQIATDSTETPMIISTETLSPTEPTSKVPTEPALPSKTPESVTFEPPPSESPVSAESSNLDRQNEVNKEPERPVPDEIETDDTEATNKVNKTTTQEFACNEKTNNCPKPPEIPSDEVVPASPQSKQPKSSQSRYQSSTANVLSSSNLRDDTKLLLEQISANSQSRIEAAKESPVTDDEKEDEADKKAKREKERGIRSLNRGQPKTGQEREKLLLRLRNGFFPRVNH
ncbi:protein FAM83H isoform X2 [Cyclopterus lumpus]|uniref:protein FAM83H isoform X2 n=1 Tax=Cyclopterus lumpus TaxID=8103 RepID=UPI001486D1B4|nr:protein FAM83H isoform X2 [Cyclopterus lumpus]